MKCLLNEFVETMKAVVENDTAYDKRYGKVLLLLYLANELGYTAGFRIDPDEPDWPVAVVELPGIGQVAWHCPAAKIEYDGHTTGEKIRRCLAFIDSVQKNE